MAETKAQLEEKVSTLEQLAQELTVKTEEQVKVILEQSEKIAELENAAQKLTANTKEQSSVIQEQAEKIAELESTNREQESLIADMQTQVESAVAQKATADTANVVEVGEDKYEVAIKRFNFKGRDYTAEEVAEDVALAAELVRVKSGVLKKIV